MALREFREVQSFRTCSNHSLTVGIKGGGWFKQVQKDWTTPNSCVTILQSLLT